VLASKYRTCKEWAVSQSVNELSLRPASSLKLSTQARHTLCKVELLGVRKVCVLVPLDEQSYKDPGLTSIVMGKGSTTGKNLLHRPGRCS
jgi:hypothetical protein